MQFPTAKTITHYKAWYGYHTNEHPYGFTIKGSNDNGASFTTLDTRTGLTSWVESVLDTDIEYGINCKSFDIPESNQGSYTHYRIEMTTQYQYSGSGNLHTRIAEVVLYSGKEGMNKWNVSKVKNMKKMFQNATSFNQDIGGWNVSQVTTISNMFENATSFDQNIRFWPVWDVSSPGSYGLNSGHSDSTYFSSSDPSLTYFYAKGRPFSDADLQHAAQAWCSDSTAAEHIFGDISDWNTSEVTDMEKLFHEKIFNEDISDWDVSNVTTIRKMFKESSFNRNITDWNLANVDLTDGLEQYGESSSHSDSLFTSSDKNYFEGTSWYTIDVPDWSSSQTYPNFDPNPALLLGQSFTNLTGTTSGGDRWKQVYKTAAQVGDQKGVLAFSSSDVNKYLRKAADDTTHTLFGGGVSCIIEGFNCYQYRYGGQYLHHQAGEFIWWMGSSSKMDDISAPHCARGFGVTMHSGADWAYTTTGNPFIAVSTGVGRGGHRKYASNHSDMLWPDGWCEDFSQENHYIPYKGSTRIDIKVDTFFCTEGYNGDNNRMRFSASVYWRYHNPGSSSEADMEWTPCIKPADTTQQIVNFSTGGMWWNHRTDGDERRGHSIKANELFHSETTSHVGGLWVGGIPNEPGWNGIGRQSSYSLSNRCGASGYRIAIINTSTNAKSSTSGWTG